MLFRSSQKSSFFHYGKKGVHYHPSEQSFLAVRFTERVEFVWYEILALTYCNIQSNTRNSQHVFLLDYWFHRQYTKFMSARPQLMIYETEFVRRCEPNRTQTNLTCSSWVATPYRERRGAWRLQAKRGEALPPPPWSFSSNP